jgi:hypothetical protein
LFAAIVAIAAVSAVAAGSVTGAASATSGYRYCADSAQVFTGTHAFVGVTAAELLGGSSKYQDCALGRMAANHIAYVREILDWASVEPKPGQYNWSVYDKLMSAVARHEMTWLPVIFDAPGWASLAPRHPVPGGVYAPRSATEMATFAKLAAERYGPGGTFWQANPTLPSEPVRAWQIWNEPNLVVFWKPSPNAGAYTRTLRACSIAIRSVDPGATIVTAGVPFGSLGAPATSFFAQMYKAGAKGSFNALSLHDYAPTVFGALERLQILRALMDHYGDSHTALWVTEFGWSTTGPPSPYRVGVWGQRSYIARFMADVERYRGQLNLGSVTYYDWRNEQVPSADANLDFWGLHTGLIRADGVPFQGLAAFAAAAAKLNG